MRKRRLMCLLAAAAWAASTYGAEPLPSWNDGAAKESILRFVSEATQEASPGYVPPADRIAVFDNDGTLWAEQPIYFQLRFALDQVHLLAPGHPEWKDK